MESILSKLLTRTGTTTSAPVCALTVSILIITSVIAEVSVTVKEPAPVVNRIASKEVSTNSRGVMEFVNERAEIIPTVPVTLNLRAKRIELSVRVCPVNPASNQEKVIFPLVACAVPKFPELIPESPNCSTETKLITEALNSMVPCAETSALKSFTLTGITT